MKKGIIALIVFVTMIGSAITVHADSQDSVGKDVSEKLPSSNLESFVISHFEDAHESSDFFDGATIDLPSDWIYSAQDEATFTASPTGDNSFIIVISRQEYEHHELNDTSFDRLFLIKAAESIMKGFAGEDADIESDIYALSNGNESAMCLIFDEDQMKEYCSITTIYGDYMYLFGANIDFDIISEDTQYFDDFDAIMSSIKDAQ